MYIELKMQIVSLLSTRHRSGNNMHTLQLNLELHENRYVQSLYVTFKQYSEISGRLKHPFSLTPIDRYSLGKLMFKISVGYDFTLARYAE